ncbi:uncharacterized protein N7482_001512 [Penicillium canariense]|uniref:NAD dependent epimerase/dehydratase n=1 Tax=Penicillium canariense TaxID=189055 RepID=A0A9W9IEB1_9EURO|nr:uncharacterized protein N7482_001512 [Penicillium canariense]KAJ5175635.1 hypothetical protein N7482_001512 [Penicillium canariense]
MGVFINAFLRNRNSTDIDRRYCAREVPMKVIMLGFPRTGTASLTSALRVLGYHHAYHGRDALTFNPRDCELWWKALQAKYNGKGKEFGRKEFDQLLGHCQAVSDIPAICFAEELIAAYPNAKVILTVREVGEWQESVRKSIIQVIQDPFLYPMIFLDHLLFMPWRWVRPTILKSRNVLWGDDFDKNGRKAFEEHYQKIQSMVPAERLLLYHVKEGWEPLCKFLGQPIPSTSMINVNDTKEFNQRVLAKKVYHCTQYIVRIVEIAAYASLFTFLWAVLQGGKPLPWQ